jgi:hypothetical protein
MTLKYKFTSYVLILCTSNSLDITPKFRIAAMFVIVYLKKCFKHVFRYVYDLACAKFYISSTNGPLVIVIIPRT